VDARVGRSQIPGRGGGADFSPNSAKRGVCRFGAAVKIPNWIVRCGVSRAHVGPLRRRRFRRVHHVDARPHSLARDSSVCPKIVGRLTRLDRRRRSCSIQPPESAIFSSLQSCQPIWLRRPDSKPDLQLQLREIGRMRILSRIFATRLVRRCWSLRRSLNHAEAICSKRVLIRLEVARAETSSHSSRVWVRRQPVFLPS